MTRLLQLFLVGLFLVLGGASAEAHGLLMKLRSDGTAIFGELYYSNGARAGGEWVEVRNLTDPAAATQTLQTATDGTFRISGLPDHRYLVVATGEEGHGIEMEMTLAAGARGQLLENGVPVTAPAEEGYPAWAVIGGLLLLSAGPALYFQRRRARSGSGA